MIAPRRFQPDHKNWIQLPFGIIHDLENPIRTRWDVRSIARSLSRIPRFVGATSEIYTVAQHSVIASEVAPKGCRLACLLHDAHECVTGDIPSSVKRFIGPVMFEAVTRPIDQAICDRFGLMRGAFEDPTVHAIDQRMFATEIRDLMPPGPWEWPTMADPFDFQITPWSSEDSEGRFISAVVECLIADLNAARQRATSTAEQNKKAGADHMPDIETSGG